MCFGKEELFWEWEDMPDWAKQEFEDNGGIPCEGSGSPAEYCSECRFGKVEVE